MTLTIKPKSICKYDIVSLGEVMLRLDPGNERIHTTRHFRVWEGGGEYNVARGLKRCFKKEAAIVTAIADNPIGHLLEDLLFQGGVDLEYVKWIPYDGIGRSVRNGLNFTEKGFGVRAALGCSDRGHSAAANLKKGDIDWEKIFGHDGVRWFHTGGIFAALSETTPEILLEALVSARKHGTIISYDLNYRSSLWKAFGGQEKAQKVNRLIAPYVDVMIGNEEDFTVGLGFSVKGSDEHVTHINTDHFKQMITEVTKRFPNFKAVATSLRQATTASKNNWGGLLYYSDNFFQTKMHLDMEIYDRIGGGDSFASGLIYGFLENKPHAEIIHYATCHGALAMTTPGDTTTASLSEVEKCMRGVGARIDR